MLHQFHISSRPHEQEWWQCLNCPCAYICIYHGTCIFTCICAALFCVGCNMYWYVFLGMLHCSWCIWTERPINTRQGSSQRTENFLLHVPSWYMMCSVKYFNSAALARQVGDLAGAHFDTSMMSVISSARGQLSEHNTLLEECRGLCRWVWVCADVMTLTDHYYHCLMTLIFVIVELIGTSNHNYFLCWHLNTISHVNFICFWTWKAT